MSNPQHVSVLILGSNPSAQLLAWLLAKRGISIRLLPGEKEPSAPAELLLHARSLELLDQAGAADEFKKIGSPVERSLFLKFDENEIQELGRSIFSVLESPHPFALSTTIEQVSKTCETLLKQVGIEYEQETNLEDFQQTADGINCRLNKGSLTCDYLVACDGSDSSVRKKLSIPNTSSGKKNYVQTARLSLTTDSPKLNPVEALLFFQPDQQLAVYPRGETELCCVSVADTEKADLKFTLEKLQKQFDLLSKNSPLPKIRLADITANEHFQHQNYLAEKFASNRTFLLGSAAHNTAAPLLLDDLNSGIEDVFNLVWKLTNAIQTNSAPPLLSSYHTERQQSLRQKLETARRAIPTNKSALASPASWLAEKITPTMNREQWFLLHSHIEFAGLDQHYTLSKTFAFEIPPQKAANQIAGKRLPNMELCRQDGQLCPIYNYLAPDHFTLFLFVNSPHPAESAPLQQAEQFAEVLLHILGKKLRILFVLPAKTFMLLQNKKTNEPATGEILIDRIGLTSDALGLLKGGACLVRPDGIIGLLSKSLDPAHTRLRLLRFLSTAKR
ncbi:MAG: FAD-dependent oxidoreductase [Chthoniobacterales bacterium]